MFVLIGCDDCANCVQYPPNCIFLNNVVNSECVSEDLVRTCEFYRCDSISYRFTINRPSCEIIDCSTLQCDNIRLVDAIDIEQTGVITILGLTEFPVPFGIIEVDDLSAGMLQEEFSCLVFTQ